ncbi:hypothetical protein BVRB_4g092070 [Beta vulgaris subsp. vulgaris]|nr:hypothetical protein BVRB_4g092070 [Beta vulgaris subsp. vulgaris]
MDSSSGNFNFDPTPGYPIESSDGDLDSSEDEVEVLPKGFNFTTSNKKKGKKRKSSIVSDVTPTAFRKKTSIYWGHYNKTNEPNSVECKYCKTHIAASSANGTSGMKNHTLRCKKFPARLDKKQRMLDFESQTIVNEHGIAETVSVPKL